MKNKLFRFSIPLLLCLTGCGDNSSVFSVPEISEEPEIIVKNLLEAIENSNNYNIYFQDARNEDARNYVELNGADYYSYLNNYFGYAIVDDDPEYAHFFSLDINRETFKLDMEMNGRIGRIEDFKRNKESMNTFHSILYENRKQFKKESDTTYVYKGYALDQLFYNFFRISEFKYTNYFELTIDKKGRLDQFRAGETYAADFSDLYMTQIIQFEYCEFEDINFVKEWYSNGKPSRTRIADYKATYIDNNDVKACYENGEITACVTAVDYDGSFFIAEEDKFNGPAGIRVTPKDGQYKPQPGDVVKVNGSVTVDKTGYYAEAPRFFDAEVSYVSEQEFPPVYNEESIVDQNGAGYIAANMFVASSFFTGSLYSGYGYAGNIPSTINRAGETTFNIYCPAWIYTATNLPFSMEVHIPYEYGEENINAMLEELRSLGDFAKNKTTTRMCFFENVIVSFNTTKELTIDLYVVPNSTISHRLTMYEWLERDYQITNFPYFPVGTTQTGMFHFGESSGYYIEDTYSDEFMGSPLFDVKEHQGGLYYYTRGTNRSEFNEFKDGLKEIGQLIDIFTPVLTSYKYHEIYKLPDNMFVDLYYEDFGGGDISLFVFIYRAEKEIRMSTIAERIDSVCGDFFKGEDFIKYPNTYEKDYHIYKLASYAGNDFSVENPLICVTLDTIGADYDTYRKAYLDAGYKVYREDGKTAYSYVTRGVSRVVYYKENDNGKKTFLDFGCYPTEDFTFLHHEAFDNRFEMLIYEADTPIHTQYTSNLDNFIKGGCETAPKGIFTWTLPEQYKCEVYGKNKQLGVYFFDYGYGLNSDAIIYPEANTETALNELFDYVVSVFEDHGYEFAYEGSRSVTYTITDPDYQETSFNKAVFCILKEKAHGYVRIIDSYGGADY